MNITDVGHLVGDGDEGEDKMEVGSRREGRSPLEIARQYEQQFFEDLKALNVELPTKILRATEAIAEQIALITILEQKGFTYKDDAAIYFDTSKLSDYGKLSGQKLSEKKTGARAGVVVDSNKKTTTRLCPMVFSHRPLQKPHAPLAEPMGRRVSRLAS
jgi:cysteinyl-tRNA synthetase